MSTQITTGSFPHNTLPILGGTAVAPGALTPAEISKFMMETPAAKVIASSTTQTPDTIYLASGVAPFGPGGSNSGSSVPPAAGGNQNGNKGSRVTQLSISELMQQSGVKFGTSGVRGKVVDMTDRVCYAYTLGFIRYLEQQGQLKPGAEIAVAGDLRPSTDRIMRAVGRAVNDCGYTLTNLGKVPSPAIALYGLQRVAPTVMITGSHIPADRNGIKFNTAFGEVLKEDEVGIRSQTVSVPEDLFGTDGNLHTDDPYAIATANQSAEKLFAFRYVNLFGDQALTGLRIGLYQHSAVGRDLLHEVLSALGAEVTPLGRSTTFVPVDTEAIRVEDQQLARQWSDEQHFDAIVSTDGDSDRPLVSDEHGQWLRGDILGILVAKFLRAHSVTTAVSSNTALEKSNAFSNVRRTKIGSPFVIASMMQATREGLSRVVGYEANGGFLTMDDIALDGKTLSKLPTRDSFLPIIAALKLAKDARKPISEIVADLPQRFTFSDRIEHFPTERGQAIVASLNSGDNQRDAAAFDRFFGSVLGSVETIDRTDGVRFTLRNGDVVHFRPSGNAPEFRVYAEANDTVRAQEVAEKAMKIIPTLDI